MIEVEKKFKPTEEQLNAMLQDAEFIGKKVLHDIYYDYPDYRMFKEDVRLRNRNGNFELKIGQKMGGVAEEVENEEDIKKYFNTSLSLEDYINQHMQPFIEYNTKRKKYKKENFIIDIDEMSFGYNLVEVELLVKDLTQVEDAENKIIQFTKNFGIEPANSMAKRNMYLKKMKPELYKKFYGGN